MKIKKKILVADDDSGILEVMKIILEEKHYQVITTDDGNLVLELANKYDPDIILIDIWMSGSDGRKITQSLKENKNTKDIPILIISALSGIETTAKEAGANGYITKPFDINELVNTIKKYLG